MTVSRAEYFRTFPPNKRKKSESQPGTTNPTAVRLACVGSCVGCFGLGSRTHSAIPLLCARNISSLCVESFCWQHCDGAIKVEQRSTSWGTWRRSRDPAARRFQADPAFSHEIRIASWNSSPMSFCCRTSPRPQRPHPACCAINEDRQDGASSVSPGMSVYKKYFLDQRTSNSCSFVVEFPMFLFLSLNSCSLSPLFSLSSLSPLSLVVSFFFSPLHLSLFSWVFFGLLVLSASSSSLQCVP